MKNSDSKALSASAWRTKDPFCLLHEVCSTLAGMIGPLAPHDGFTEILSHSFPVPPFFRCSSPSTVPPFSVSLEETMFCRVSRGERRMLWLRRSRVSILFLGQGNIYQNFRAYEKVNIRRFYNSKSLRSRSQIEYGRFLVGNHIQLLCSMIIPVIRYH